MFFVKCILLPSKENDMYKTSVALYKSQGLTRGRTFSNLFILFPGPYVYPLKEPNGKNQFNQVKMGLKTIWAR